jgi:hypothetical protein
MAIDLKPCPFCSGQAIFEQIKGAVGDEIRWSVGCRTDICIAFQMMANYPRRSDAAAAWNKRPSQETEVLRCVTANCNQPCAPGSPFLCAEHGAKLETGGDDANA